MRHNWKRIKNWKRRWVCLNCMVATTKPESGACDAPTPKPGIPEMRALMEAVQQLRKCHVCGTKHAVGTMCPKCYQLR